MTRDDAIKIINDSFRDGRTPAQVWLVDAFEKLGILKLDKPATIEDRVETLLVGTKLATCSTKTMGAEIGLSDVSTIVRMLDAANLKIVEK